MGLRSLIAAGGLALALAAAPVKADEPVKPKEAKVYCCCNKNRDIFSRKTLGFGAVSTHSYPLALKSELTMSLPIYDDNLYFDFAFSLVNGYRADNKEHYFFAAFDYGPKVLVQPFDWLGLEAYGTIGATLGGVAAKAGAGVHLFKFGENDDTSLFLRGSIGVFGMLNVSKSYTYKDCILGVSFSH